jgi:hypothetical protein
MGMYNQLELLSNGLAFKLHCYKMSLQDDHVNANVQVMLMIVWLSFQGIDMVQVLDNIRGRVFVLI